MKKQKLDPIVCAQVQEAEFTHYPRTNIISRSTPSLPKIDDKDKENQDKINTRNINTQITVNLNQKSSSGVPGYKKHNPNSQVNGLPMDIARAPAREGAEGNANGKVGGLNNSSARPLPPSAPASKKKPTYYKSKFWDYVVPKKNDRVAPSRTEKGKKYDQLEVRSYIEKQKELRRQKEKVKDEEKRLVLEKKKLQLQELDEKRKDLMKPCTSKKDTLSNAGKDAPQLHPHPQPHCSTQQSQPAKKTRTKSNLTPMKVMRSSETNEDSHTALQTSLLLHEFENIIHNECLNVIKNHSRFSTTSVPKVDKSVETTNSLFEGHGISSTSLSLTPTTSEEFEFPLKPPKKPASSGIIANLKARNQAAVQIQAFFRGYKVRKYLREAHIYPPRSRRKSFYGSSDKPTDQNLSMRPNAIRSIVPQYIMTPRPRSGSSRYDNVEPTPTAPKVEKFTPYKSPSRFEEPFPKEAIRQQQLNSPSPSSSERAGRQRRLSLESPRVQHQEIRFESPHSAMLRRLSLSMEAPLVQPKSFDINTVDIQVPTFSTVFREKYRLLHEMAQKASPTANQAEPTKEEEQAKRYRFPHRSEKLKLYDSDASLTENGDLSITDNYIGPDVEEMKKAYDLRKTRTTLSDVDSSSQIQRPTTRGVVKVDHNSNIKDRSNRSERHSSSASCSASSTTVETDLELKVNEKLQRVPKVQSSEVGSSSSIPLKKYPIPTIELAYKAENERLNILDQALQTTMALEVAKVQREAQLSRAANEAQTRELQSLILNSNAAATAATMTSNSEVLIQLAKCQAEQLKTTAEVTRWVSELRKSSADEHQRQQQQQPIDMAAIVFAAVEEAKKVSQERESFLKQQLQTQAQRKILLKDQVHQFPSESSTSETVPRMKMKATEKGTQLLELQVRRLQQEQEQRLISSPKESKDPSFNTERSNENFPTSSVQSEPSYAVDFESESPPLTEISQSQRTPQTSIKEASSIPEDLIQEVEISTQSSIPDLAGGHQGDDEYISSPEKVSTSSSQEIIKVESPPQSEDPISELPSIISNLETGPGEMKMEVSETTADVVEPPETTADVVEPPEEELIEEEEHIEEQEEKLISRSEEIGGHKDLSFNSERSNENFPMSSVPTDPSYATDFESDSASITEVSQNERTPQADIKEIGSIPENLVQYDEFSTQSSIPDLVDTDKEDEPISSPKKDLSSQYDEFSTQPAIPDLLGTEKEDEPILSPKKDLSSSSNEIKVESPPQSESEDLISKLPSIVSNLEIFPGEMKTEVAETETIAHIEPPEEELIEEEEEKLISSTEEIGGHLDDQSELPPIIPGVTVEISGIKLEVESPLEQDPAKSMLVSKPPEENKYHIYQISEVDTEFEAELESITCSHQQFPQKYMKSLSEPKTLNSISESIVKRLLNEVVQEEPKQPKTSIRKQAAEIEDLPQTNVDESVIIDTPPPSYVFKPPPPYSPPSSSSSSSSSGPAYPQFFSLNFDEHIIKDIITSKVENIWVDGKPILRNDVELDVKDSAKPDVPESFSALASRAFTALLEDTAGQLIPEILNCESERDKSFMDKIRPGRLALAAQRQKIPKTKERLIQNVLQKFLVTIPIELAPDSAQLSSNQILTKWSSRVRDPVDEVLVQEMVEEDRDWTEYGPEEILVTERIKEYTIRRAIKEVVDGLKMIHK